MLYYHDGRTDIVEKSNLVIDSFTVDHEGIAICQVKDKDGKILDEKHIFLTTDRKIQGHEIELNRILLATELIDHRFEGYEQGLIDSEINSTERHCGPDKHIEYEINDVADFHIDFVQHYERIRQHSNHIEVKNIKHENEGYYECIVRLHNGLVGVRVFFLSVGGGPRQISNRETHFYAEINDSITLLCPTFSAMPAWYSFIPPKDSSVVGNDYLRIKHLSEKHSGMYTCRVATNEEDEGYSVTSNFHLDVYGKMFELYSPRSPRKYILLGPPEYIEPYKSEYALILVERNIENPIGCSIRGNPTPSYQWFFGDVKEGNKEEVLADSIYYVIKPNENDAPESKRTVTCIARNNRGSKRQVFTLQFVD